MEKRDYSILDSVLIENCDLIVQNEVIYRLCLKNKINTLGEFYKKLENNEINIINKKTKEQVKGFIDLVNYYYFNEKLIKSNLLFNEIRILEDTWRGNKWPGRYEASFKENEKFSLRRLGFSSDEESIILHYVEQDKSPTLIINAILRYLDDSKGIYIHLKKKQLVFIKKLELIKKYYKEVCFSRNDIYINKLIELEEKIKEFSNLISKKEKIEKELELINNDINIIRNYVNEDDMNTLVKRYINKK